ncbi:3-oxoadipate enol-lactonase [Novosphingobium flavum]|uniref:3-oxoadipate enol-lactonase n=1 Tax=Novosphingobium aerophilum TaxID=2839843 RepID=UPI00163AAE0F|nr:3-oxoadipate enol-lactonase [Novosphingobium aerophilum]MBC2660162.1 3-oxoadipate enol-lactonase [Novosphingobium aerophilum]
MTHRHGLAQMTDGASIAWSLEGPEDRPVLMLSNSLGTSMAMWEPQLPRFAERFRVLRYDTRGHGRSWVSPGDYSLDRLGRDAVELLDALAIDAADFCGLSLGGMTGQWLGVFAPERVKRLVLANTSAYMGPPAVWQDRIHRVRGEGMAAIADAVVARWFTAGFQGAAGAARVRTGLLATSPVGYSACCAAIRDMDLRPLVHLIHTPTLIISGLQDPATPPEHAMSLHEQIAGSTLVSLDASHLSNVEQPAAFADAVLAFLA